MLQTLTQQIELFLDEAKLPKTPKFLVGLSGGPDSMALYILLSRLQEKYSFSLKVAHVDHALRTESSSEAESLKFFVEGRGHKFFSKRLNFSSPSNLEEEARNKRLDFFKQIMQREQCDYLCLGHHADDQVETVLKRIFEGACLWNIKGMLPIAKHVDIYIMRPLLFFYKKDIQSMLDKENIKYFLDPTNDTGQNLRSIFRLELIPFIQNKFGKNIKKNILKLSEQSYFLNESLRLKNHKSSSFIYTSYLGILLNYHLLQKENNLEQVYILKSILINHPYSLIRKTLHQLKSKKPNLKADAYTFCDRGYAFFKKRSFPEIDQNLSIRSLEQLEFSWGGIHIIEGKQALRYSEWKDFFMQGSLMTSVIEGEYKLVMGENMISYMQKNLKNNKRLKKHWSKHQIPNFLRDGAPVLIQGDQVKEEFFISKAFYPPIKDEKYFKVILYFKVEI